MHILSHGHNKIKVLMLMVNNWSNNKILKFQNFDLIIVFDEKTGDHPSGYYCCLNISLNISLMLVPKKKLWDH